MKLLTFVIELSVFLTVLTVKGENVTLCHDSCCSWNEDIVINEEFDIVNVADTVIVNATDTLSTADISAQLEGRECGLDVDLYRHYNGPDFRFFENSTYLAAIPHTFLDDQTWVDIPVFLAGLIAKFEKTGFQQDYNNSTPTVRLIKYDFHNEIDNYTQFSGIALTVGLKLAGVEGRSSWPRLFASSLASYAVMAYLEVFSPDLLNDSKQIHGTRPRHGQQDYANTCTSGSLAVPCASLFS